MLIVIVAAGPDKGRIYELDGTAPVVIGREGADIRLNDTKVSRRHARLWCEGGRWYAQDFNSRSGTRRNDTVIEGRHPLNDGDRLRVGGSLLVATRKLSDTAPDREPQAAEAPEPVAAYDVNVSQRPRTFAWAAGAAAATVLIGLNLASLMSQQRAARDLDAGLDQNAAATAAVTAGVSELRGFVSDTPEVRNAIQRLADDTGRRLDVATAAIQRQADGDAALARGVEEVRDLQVQRGQDVAQLAGTLSGVRQQLDGLEGLGQASQLAAELTALRTALAAPDGATSGLAAIETRLDALAAQVDAAAPAGGLESVAAALEELRRDGAAQAAAVSAALAPRLDALAARLEAEPGGAAVALKVDESLARMAAELRARPDAGLIREQLTAVLDARDAAPGTDAIDDPILGQVLAELQTLNAGNQRLDQQLAALREAPFENRAMLDEALARLGQNDQATQAAVTQQLDQAMAELRGKSITDADQLRRLINREVVAAVRLNLRQGQPQNGTAVADARRQARSQNNERLTRTEAAYQLAFESGRKVAIGGGTIDPTTGAPVAGRTLDPADAQARGLDNWRDWYLMDDLAARKSAREAADRVLARDRSRGTGVLQLPGARDADVSVNASLTE